MKMFAVMMRNNSLALSAALFLLLVAGGCKAQTTKASETLSDEIIHRIQSEIRSRYKVPSEIGVSISAPRPSDFPGYDQIVVTFTGGTHSSTHEFLISKDRKTLAHLEKFDISTDWMSKIDVKGRPFRGSEQAKAVIISYQDFQCSFCSRMHSTLFPGLLQEYAGRVKVIYKNYPLTEIHPWALHAAVDADCLADQNQDAYWDFADYVFANQKQVGGRAPEEAFLNLDKSALEQGINKTLPAVPITWISAAPATFARPPRAPKSFRVEGLLVFPLINDSVKSLWLLVGSGNRYRCLNVLKLGR